jgi:hypothetical protein
MTGAIIGLSISEPIIAVPLAVGSHFVLDAIPHFGEKKVSFTSPVFNNLLKADVILCAALVSIIMVVRPRNWILAIVCATLAAGVDFMHIPRYLKSIKTGTVAKPTTLVGRFHSRIQWFERPPGAVVEIVWATAAIVVLSVLLNK